MDKKYFDDHVIMAVEIESDYGRHWTTMPGEKVKDFLQNLSEDEGLSDIDYCTNQEDPEIRDILDKAEKIWMDSDKRQGFKSLDEVIDSLLVSKRIWMEDEIKNLVQTNDRVLYGALKKMFSQQTADEQEDGETTHANGIGFNGVDAPFMTSICKFLEEHGWLSDKQKAIARKKLVKYNRQLTRLANA